MTTRGSDADRTSPGRLIGRAGRFAALGLTSLALAAVTALPVVSPAAADPPLTVADAKAQIEQLEIDAAAIDQDYAGVQEKIKQGQASLDRKQSDMVEQSAKVARMKAQVGQVALAQFQNRSLDTAAQLFVNSDTEGFLSQISTVEKVSENQNSVLQDFQQQQANLAELAHSSKTDLAALAEQEKELKRLRDASAKKVTDAKAILSRLTAEQRRQIAAEQRRAASSVRSQAERTVVDVPASGRGARAVAFAKSQLGKPYRFGATGPGAYDCSGLTGAAWRAAGVSLSRTSQSQFHDGRPVSRSDLRPGDLVFFYGGISHVGLYVGNGMMIHAPRPGKSVEYSKISYMPYAGARRPG